MRSRGNTLVWKSKLVPDKIHIKMPYHTFYTLASTVSQAVVMRGNGPYDPDVIVGGTQPPLYDDLSLLYYEYYVIGSSITVRFINNGADTAKVYLFPHNAISTYNFTSLSGAQIDNQQYAQTRTLSPATTGSSNTCTFKAYMSTNKMAGRKTQDDQAWASATNTTPTNEWTWQVGAYDYTSGTIPLNIHVEINIVYYTEWRKRANVVLDD